MQVERHIRGKWSCERCETLIQAPVPPQVIDKGFPTAGLLAQVLVAKYAGHLPLYRQEQIFSRAGVAIPRSTLAQWVGACGVKLEPPLPMLTPGLKQTQCSDLWAYGTTTFDSGQMVVYDFAEGRSGQHARSFLASWKGSVVCDDYQGYDALFRDGVTEVALHGACAAKVPRAARKSA